MGNKQKVQFVFFRRAWVGTSSKDLRPSSTCLNVPWEIKAEGEKEKSRQKEGEVGDGEGEWKFLVAKLLPGAASWTPDRWGLMLSADVFVAMGIESPTTSHHPPKHPLPFPPRPSAAAS